MAIYVTNVADDMFADPPFPTDATITAAGPTRITVQVDGITANFLGSFSYDQFGNLVSGWLESSTVFSGATLLGRIDEINRDFFTLADLPTVEAFGAYIFSGNDHFTGSLYADRLRGFAGNDTILGSGGDDDLYGEAGDDELNGGLGNDTLRGGAGSDTAVFSVAFSDVVATEVSGGYQLQSAEGADIAQEIEFFRFTDRLVAAADLIPPPPDPAVELIGTDFADSLVGGSGNDRLVGLKNNDTLDGGDGADTLNGGDGDDLITGGATEADRRDVIYAGAGHDSVDAGHGNDLVYGMDGNDTIAGGFGADELIGQNGDDVINGSAFSDLVFGGAGNDFVNGGFGSDRVNGGTGADRFFHFGTEGHGSDWIQDYDATESDVLLFGNASATRSDFQVNFAHTENAFGERSGDDAVMEAFVIYRPTGQIMWALVDGDGQASINLQIGGELFDLLA